MELCQNMSPLTLYIDFHNLFFLDINRLLLILFINKCMHIHLSPNIPMYKRRRYIFMKSKNLIIFFVYSSIRQLYCCDITETRRVPPERVT